VRFFRFDTKMTFGIGSEFFWRLESGAWTGPTSGLVRAENHLAPTAATAAHRKCEMTFCLDSGVFCALESRAWSTQCWRCCGFGIPVFARDPLRAVVTVRSREALIASRKVALSWEGWEGIVSVDILQDAVAKEAVLNASVTASAGFAGKSLERHAT
jgi:hypothetical protein